ncbi:hypothetical protein HBI56_019430 [Parastagonospora nodorum]|uniref:Uncharacterized protein n=1 Tax=Phaeosphaeria nodorum (strain SN15 / ATCC MYA-4574 / FGSC 10173) TaxID=321614 RepID=A0A7U2I1P9_PHANO|nr:hypothetical protein HBH56_080540 [Parastagonospora nodorum]QRC96511.1 hypothetical protein JI435_409160 [Parastagonospora nodorum SN15]KAH3929820.1 hypothetical protein HBH54_121280 [Parastagonospora nodorum]KAH3955815.1 hypothetical protein HBH53_003340 [Parastagonospora nodorum]KAH3976838.1 hypothetical protein HBH51_078230 [Parastagonospora nodorum]
MVMGMQSGRYIMDYGMRKVENESRVAPYRGLTFGTNAPRHCIPLGTFTRPLLHFYTWDMTPRNTSTRQQNVHHDIEELFHSVKPA